MSILKMKKEKSLTPEVLNKQNAADCVDWLDAIVQ